MGLVRSSAGWLVWVLLDALQRAVELISSHSLICRKRHVKCTPPLLTCNVNELMLLASGDESRPRCASCRRREETCEYANPIRFKQHVVTHDHKRRTSSSQSIVANSTVELSSAGLGASPTSSFPSPGIDSPRQPSGSFGVAARLSPFQQRVSPYRSQAEASAVLSQSPEICAQNPMINYEYSYSDAKYLHHFASKLGRWLDCTDPKRQFTVKIPQLVSSERILLLAVTCFAARHMKDTSKAILAHEESVNLLISRLNVANVASDDALLCAIVILRVYEQLDGKFATPSHLHRLKKRLQHPMLGSTTSDIWPAVLPCYDLRRGFK